MMKIRYALLLSVSCLGFGSLANAGLTPDITPVGKNTSIFTLRGTPADESLLRLSHSSYTHLASQSKLLSASVIARRTSSDEAIHNNINGSPRRINSPRDDTDDFLSTQHKELEASRLLLPEQDTADLPLTASVCFITNAGNCRGDEYDYGGANTPDNSSGGTPGGSSSGGDNDDDWTLDNKERCHKEGYTQTSCSSVQDPVNYCPYDNTYFEKCDCKPGLMTCTKPYYGVGESCGGKYASCQLDNDRACKEDGYSQTGSCNSVQNINKRCPYDANYFDKCVCRSDLYTCSSPLQGVGTACGGKYADCQCPSSYKTCDCGGAAGASSCTWGGTTKYSSCKACCSDICPSGSKSVSCSGGYQIKVATTECGTACYSCEGVDNNGLYHCNGKIEGVRVSGTNIVVGYKDVGNTHWTGIHDFVSQFKFCGKSGRLPTKAELLAIAKDMPNLRQKLSQAGGRQFSSEWYWTSDYSGRCPYHSGDYYYIVNPITGNWISTGCDVVDYLRVRAVMDI